MAAVAHVFVASANYPARRRGIHAAMLVREAQQLCPELALVDVPLAEVEDASDALMDLFGELAAAVEPGSMEEAFLDVGATDAGAAHTAAREVRRRAAADLGLPVTVGIGRTKLMAKLASRAAKPDGLGMVGPDQEADLRAHLPLTEAWGVGALTVQRLRAIGVVRLQDLDAVSGAEVEAMCGTGMARRLRSYRDGTDDAEVRPVAARTVLKAEAATAGYRRPDATPLEMVIACAERVCRRAGRAGLVGRGMTLMLRPEQGGKPLTYRHVEPDPSAASSLWLPIAAGLIKHVPLPPLQGLSVSLTGLQAASQVPATLF